MNYIYDLSIVLPTLGRMKEVDALLASIYSSGINPRYKVEIIVIDQNFSDLLDDVILKYSNKAYPITQYKVSFRGLSKAKNFGTTKAKGRYVCFIDDDAEFIKDSVNLALCELESNTADVVSGRCIDRDGNDSVCQFDDMESMLTLDNFEGKFVESTMFFNTDLCHRYSYDVEMGVGAFYGAEEGYDLVYRLLRDGIRIKFNPEIKFYHPQTVLSRESQSAIRRAFTYRCGYGHLCKKYHFRKKFYIRILKLIAYLFVLPIYKPKNYKYYLADLLGSLTGYYL